jgi:sugar fermentation stimulation protein A
MVSFFDTIERAAFLDRPNRFTIRCIVKGKRIPVYLPNPGRLWELMIPGATVYLERAVPAGRKLPFTAVAVERSGTPIMLHTHRTNDVASVLIEKGLIPGLEGARIRRREVPVNHSRIDFLLDRGREQIFLEVKSCTLFSKRVAMFPDAVTARGKKHLEELVKIRGKGRRGAILFIVHCPHAEFFLPEYHTDLEFSLSFLKAREKLTIMPIAVGWKRNLTLEEKVAPLNIPWKVLAKEAKDRGSYLIILRLPRRKVISVGKLGKVPFQKGYYVYTGSARKNLSRRIERHRRLTKKHFWHIDYLREAGEFIAALPVRTEDDVECRIARSITALGDWEIPFFGSSDCTCTTHLSGMEDNPLRSPAFHEMLQYFRMERLVHDK